MVGCRPDRDIYCPESRVFADARSDSDLSSSEVRACKGVTMPAGVESVK